MKHIESFMVDELTAVFATETSLTDGSVVHGVRILQREWKVKTSVEKLTEVGPKKIDVHFHCIDEDAANDLYKRIANNVVEIETLNRRATK